MTDIFADQNPAYFLGDRTATWGVPSEITALSTLINEMVDQSLASGDIVTHTVRLSAKIGVPGQVLAEVVETTIVADGNTVTYQDGAGFVLEQVTDFGIGAVTAALFTAGAVALGVTPAGWLTAAVVGTGSVLLSNVIDIDQAIEVVAGTVDVEFKIKDSSGQVLGGVWYRDGIGNINSISLSNAIADMLAKSGQLSDTGEAFPLVEQGMTIEFLYQNAVEDVFKVFDGKVIEDLAGVFGLDVNTFLENTDDSKAFWNSGVSELNFNLYSSDGQNSWVFARNSDRLVVNTDDLSITPPRSFHPSEILTNISLLIEDTGQNLIVGTDSDDVISAGLGADVVYGGAGSDLIKASSPEGSYYNGGFIADIENANDTDRVDYSDKTFESITLRVGESENEDARVYQTAGLEFQEEDPAFIPVFDRIVSIESIILSDFDDFIQTAVMPGLKIDGGAGHDTLNLDVTGAIVNQSTNQFFVDVNSQALSYENVEDVNFVGTPTTLVVDADVSGEILKYGYNDYSASDKNADFNIGAYNYIDSSDDIGGVYFFEQSFRTIVVTEIAEQYGDSYYKDGSGSQSSVYSSARHNNVIGTAHFRGTDHGDDVTVRSHHFLPTNVSFISGYGSDTIDVGNGYIASNGSVSVEYTRGDDVISGSSISITSLDLWSAIRPSDVTMTNNVITIDGYGTITLQGMTTADININFLGTEKAATIDGSWSDETWTGYDGRDEIFYGLGGNDVLNGNGGQDQLYGGVGNDTLTSLKGANILDGGVDDDVYYVSKNALTTISDQFGSNALYATDFNQSDMRFALNSDGMLVIEDVVGNAVVTIDVNSEFAHIEFQNGDVLTLTEALALAAGNTATYDTGGGRDTVDSVGVVGGTVMIDLKGGNDIYYGRFADISDIIYGGDGREYIQSGFGDDTIFGGRGDDYHLNGEEGNDYIDGGEGRDTYIIGSSTGIGGHVDLTAGIAYNDGYGGVDTLVSIEGVTGTDFDDLVVGDASDNHFSSDEGADTFYGMDGSDTVILSSRYVGENRYIDGGDGSDWVRYDDSSYNQSLVIDLGAGTVSGKGKAGQDTLVSIENVVGSLAGGDHITGSDADNTVYLDSFYDLGGTVLGMGGNDTLYGSAYEDTLEGGDGVDVLIGRDGNDTLIGGAGNDTLEGGAGDDTYIFAAGDGIDVIRDTEGENIFIIEGGINIEDLVTTRKGNDLILHIASGVTFENYFESEPADNAFVVQTTTGQQVDAKMLEINNEAPTAQNDEFETLQDLIVTGNVFSDNGYGADSDPDGDILHATPLSLSTDFGGTFTLLEDGSFTYTPEQGFSGIDTVTYSITDGYEGTDSAEITFIVTDPNLPPEAQDDVVNAQEDTEIIIDVLANDTDANGDDLTVSIESAPTNGTVVVNADQTVTYTANENYNGADSFTYTIDDGHGRTDTASVNITVAAVNDNPVAQNDSASTQYNQAVTLTAAQLLQNDSDVENDAVEITSVLNAQDGTAVLNSDGSVTFTPDNGFSGAASFEYTLSDGQGGSSTASVHVDVGSPPDNTDVIYGTDNNDMLFGTRDDDIIEANGGNDHVFAKNGDDEVHGGAGNDMLFGGNGDDLLYGDDGHDLLFGQRGDNELNGGKGDDLLAGSSGRDVLSGGEGDDLLLGNNGNDVLNGGEGADRVYGGRGDDLLFFGEDSDYLYGGSGNDVFKAIANDTIESSKIGDFDARNDALDISDILTGYDPMADVLSDFVDVETSRSRATVYVDRDGQGSEYGWEQLVQMQVKGASNISSDEDQLVNDGILVV